jgi:hypothetical protein
MEWPGICDDAWQNGEKPAVLSPYRSDVVLAIEVFGMIRLPNMQRVQAGLTVAV